MSTSREQLGAGRPAKLGAIAEALVQLTVKARAMLPLAGNNGHIAPSAPGVAVMRRDVACGKARPWHYLVSIAACDLADGVPVAVVTAAPRQFIAEIEALASERAQARGGARRGAFPRPMGVIIAMETRAQQRLDLAELKLAESPTSQRAIEDVLAECDRYAASFDTLQSECRDRLALVRSGEPTLAVERPTVSPASRTRRIDHRQPTRTDPWRTHLHEPDDT